VAVDILERAIINCRGIVATPAPRVAVKSITGACGEFEMTFFVEELSSALEAQNELFDLIFRHLTVAGIDLAPDSAHSGRPGSNLRQIEIAA
jgi:small-conductance mechanosensitive channel